MPQTVSNTAARIDALLREHPLIGASDLLLLTELDYGMARSGNRFVAREIARALNLNYAIAYHERLKGEWSALPAFQLEESMRLFDLLIRVPLVFEIRIRIIRTLRRK